MSKFPKKLDSNDFWNDCLKESQTIIKHYNPKYSNNIELSPLSFYTSNKKRNKKIYKYDTKSSFHKSKIIQKAIISEENAKSGNDKKFQESIDYMVSLYNRGMLSKEKKKKSMAQSRQKHISIEKKECSFRPKKYSNSSLQKKIKKNFGNSTIYERGIKYQQNRMAKIAKLFEENYKKNNIVYPFHPEVSSKNLNKVFFSDNFCKEQTDNDSNKIFLSRLMKAREEEEYKKNCLENKINKKNVYNLGYPNNQKRLKKSLSQKDSLFFRKNLHNALLNLKCFPSNEENDEKIEDYFLS